MIAKQYADPHILAKVRAAYPYDLNHLLPSGIIQQSLDWFKTFMKWDKSPNLLRSNSVLNILETRRGRCGEWANLYTAVLNSLGVESRLVLDFTDHVWTEVLVNSIPTNLGQRWMHIDSTLSIVDSPLFYEREWKKKLTFVVAFSPTHITDVTYRYTTHMGLVRRRGKKFEPLFQALCGAYNHTW